jgi:hypothetical protein
MHIACALKWANNSDSIMYRLCSVHYAYAYAYAYAIAMHYALYSVRQMLAKMHFENCPIWFIAEKWYSILLVSRCHVINVTFECEICNCGLKNFQDLLQIWCCLTDKNVSSLNLNKKYTIIVCNQSIFEIFYDFPKSFFQFFNAYGS